jgi:inosine/guanosine/xanthosine phosphorylase family protein
VESPVEKSKKNICNCQGCNCCGGCNCCARENTDLAKQAFEIIQETKEIKAAKGFSPKVGMILGSGLTPLVESIEVIASFSYAEFPGFFESTVAGHAGSLVLGRLNGVDVACLNGRVHYYEGASSAQLCAPIRLLKLLGCESLIITNAAGGINPTYTPGGVAIVADQINFSFTHPLLGPNNLDYGTRFPSMENAFDSELRLLFHRKAKALGINLPEGIYIGVSGPSYETPAEVRMYRNFGADLVGMSTVNEVIIARHCGLKVVVLSAIANLAVGLASHVVTHQDVLVYGKVAAESMQKLIHAAVVEM